MEGSVEWCRLGELVTRERGQGGKEMWGRNAAGCGGHWSLGYT